MRIAPLFLKYDYGNPDRGASGELKFFLPALESIYGKENIFPFWLEDNGFRDNMNDLQIKIVEHCKFYEIDMVFMILMEFEIHPLTIRELRKNGIKVLNWFCDSQWRAEWERYIAPELDYSIICDKYSVNRFKEYGCKTFLSNWGTDYIAENIKSKYIYDVSFIGSVSEKRKAFVEFLDKCGVKVNCFGNGWPNGKVSQEMMREIFLNSKINLNLSNSEGMKMVEQIKARTFEIPACGGFQLSQFALEIEDYFIPGKEIALFGDPIDLHRQIQYYLQNKSERESIKKAGWGRAKAYTYENQLRRVLCKLG